MNPSEALGFLRAAQFNRSGLPAVGSQEARALCELINDAVRAIHDRERRRFRPTPDQIREQLMSTHGVMSLNKVALNTFLRHNGKYIESLHVSETTPYAQLPASQDLVFSDKEGIVVQFVQGPVAKTQPNGKAVIHIKLTNTSEQIRILLSWRLIDKPAHIKLSDEFGCHGGEPAKLSKNSTEFVLTVIYTPEQVEQWGGIIEFKFDSFTILKPIQVICETAELLRMKHGVTKYRPQRSNPATSTLTIESEGEPPTRS
jgi:hypothetical protein